MRIPATTVKPRFYVATKHRNVLHQRALSSWDTLDGARRSIQRLREAAIQNPRLYKKDLDSVVCITETGPNGWVWHPPDVSNNQRLE